MNFEKSGAECHSSDKNIFLPSPVLSSFAFCSPAYFFFPFPPPPLTVPGICQGMKGNVLSHQKYKESYKKKS